MVSPETYKLIRNDKKSGIEHLYNGYGRKLYGYAVKSWSLDEDSAWEVVYKTLYKVVESVERYEFESEQKFESFVFKVFVNNLRMFYRDQKRVKEHLEFTEISSASELEDSQIRAQHNTSKSMGLLKEELEKLEDWERVLLLLRSQDMPYSEIAKHVDKPEGQLKVYYQRLKDKLTNRINERMEAPKQS